MKFYLLFIVFIVFGCRFGSRTQNQTSYHKINEAISDSVWVLYSSMSIIDKDTQKVLDTITILNQKLQSIFLPLPLGMGTNKLGKFTLDYGYLSSQQDIFFDGNRNNSSDRIALIHEIVSNDFAQIIYNYSLYGKRRCTKVHYRIPLILNSKTKSFIDSTGVNFPLLFRYYKTNSVNVKFQYLFEEKCR